jgi:hypothetical protein
MAGRMPGFFDIDERLRELSAKGDDLERINEFSILKCSAAIADAAGGQWAERARSAALEQSAVGLPEEDSLPIMLLSDIRSAFTARKTDRLPPNSGKDMAARAREFLKGRPSKREGKTSSKPVQVVSFSHVARVQSDRTGGDTEWS